MSDNEFPRQFRLLTAVDFRCVFNNTQLRVNRQALLVLATPNGLDHPRLGLVIAKRNVSKAVQRNRLKRLIRDSFRRNRKQLAALDLVFLTRPGVAALDNQKISALIESVWNKLSDITFDENGSIKGSNVKDVQGQRKQRRQSR